MTVRFDFASGPSAPVLGPFTVVPIDTPMFLAGHEKSLTGFSYTSYDGRAEQKGLGDLGFARRVKQRVVAVAQEEVDRLLGDRFAKSMEHAAFTKSLVRQPVTEARLKTGERQVRQWWQAGRPWPVYCDNGYTVSRLVAFTPAGKDSQRNRQ
jgi:hypothetical protein